LNKSLRLLRSINEGWSEVDKSNKKALVVQREKIFTKIRGMIISWSGRYWRHYNADTAVTEYRGLLLSKVDEFNEAFPK